MNRLLVRLAIVALLSALCVALVNYQDVDRSFKKMEEYEDLLASLKKEQQSLLRMPEQRVLPVTKSIWDLEQFLTQMAHYKNIEYSTSVADDSHEQQINIHFDHIRDSDDLRRYMTLIAQVQSQFPVRITRIEGLRQGIILKLNIVGGS